MADLKLGEKKFRPEIEGLRLVAILLVVIYHFWLNRVSGGIDVFFVLSGFLVTLSLLSRVNRNDMHVGRFWLGLAKRLYPQAIVVMVVTLLAGLYFIPETQWPQMLKHVIASVFYGENWRLAFDAVDYLAQDQAASPFQHFWSLSVQGQIYILWPFILFVCYLVFVKKFGLPLRKVILTALTVIFIASISYSVYKTNTNQAWAYFDTFARIWEFSIGGMLALLLPYIKFPKVIHFITGWLGLLTICTTGLLLQVSTVFPGYMALVPIGGALFVLMSAQNPSKYGVHILLSRKPFLKLGNLSYGIYLWHWPILRFYQEYFGTTEVKIWHGILMLLLTVVLSYISTNFIEKPIRMMKPGKFKYKGLAVTVAFVASFALVFTVFSKQAEPDVVVADGEQHLGAEAIYNHIEVDEEIEFVPDLISAPRDIPSFYEQKECVVFNSEFVRKCSYGVTDNPDYVLALVGGSHSGHWFSMLEILAQDLNFQIDLYNHDGCRFSVADPDQTLSENCIKWNDNLIEQLKADDPDVVFTTATLNYRDHVPQGFIEQWKKLEGEMTIFAVRDNPRMDEDIPSCLAREDNPSDCDIAREKGLSDVVPWENTEGIPSNVVFADLSDYFCDDTTCKAVIGNVVVYRDQHHMTDTYVKTLAPVMRPYLEELFESLSTRPENISSESQSE